MVVPTDRLAFCELFYLFLCFDGRDSIEGKAETSDGLFNLTVEENCKPSSRPTARLRKVVSLVYPLLLEGV